MTWARSFLQPFFFFNLILLCIRKYNWKTCYISGRLGAETSVHGLGKAQLAGPEDAVGRGTHQAREDGWLQRLKLTVCANSSSGEPHVPSISLLTRRCKKSRTTLSSFASASSADTHPTSNENTNRGHKHTIGPSPRSLRNTLAFSEM